MIARTGGPIGGASSILDGGGDYNFLPRSAIKTGINFAQQLTEGKRPIKDFSEGSDMFGRAQPLVFERLKNSAQTFASIPQGGDYHIQLPAVVVVTPAAAALTAPIQRQLSNGQPIQINTFWEKVKEYFPRQVESQI